MMAKNNQEEMLNKTSDDLNFIGDIVHVILITLKLNFIVY